MNPMMLNFAQPQGMSLGTMNGNTLTMQRQADPRLGNSLQELNAGILERARRARAQGMSESDVQLNIAQDLAEQSESRANLATAPTNFTKGKDTKKGNMLTKLLPTIGGVLGGVGLAAAPVTGGASLLLAGLGGIAGSVGGKLAQNALEDEELTRGLAGEAAFGALGGALPMLRGGKMLLAGRAAAAGDDVARAGASVADDIVQQGNRVQRTGAELRMNARGMNEAGKLFPSQPERMAASKVMDEVGLKGSARNQFRNISPAITALNERAGKVLSAHPASADALDFAGEFTRTANKAIDAEKPGFQTALNRLTDTVLGRADPKTGKLTAQQMYDLKSELGNELSSAWKKLENGTRLSAEENAYMKVWQSLDNKLTSLVPEAKQLSKAQSMLIQAQPVLDKASNSSGKLLFGVLPTNAPSQIIQRGQDTTGRVLQMFGGAGGRSAVTGAATSQTVKNGVGRNVARQVVPRMLLGGYAGGEGAEAAGDPSEYALNMFGNEQDANDFASQLEAAGIDMGGVSSAMLGGQAGAGAVSMGADGKPTGTSGQQWDEVNGLGVLSREAVARALATDLQETGGKNFAQILTYADYVNQTGDYAPATQDGGLDANGQKAMVGLQSAINTIDQVEQLYTSAGGGQGRVSGTAANLFGKLTGSGADTYNQQVGGFAGQITRALGNTGAMSDQDVARAVGLLPKITDTPAQARTKLNALRSLIQANTQAVYQTGTGMAPAQDLSGVAV